EIATVAGPQLVVPVDNARYALNAANARWGSLYDALYGTDAIPDTDGAERGAGFNPVRGAKVVEAAADFLDASVGLAQGSFRDVAGFRVGGSPRSLVVTLGDGSETALAAADKFAGFNGAEDAPTCILLRNNGLHIEIQIDRDKPIGSAHPAGINDVFLE
ncbi:MAG: malate synthase G, partial [Gammaproteobacteria bacterium]|nr:malate synthase G [Gammaproteobacteria bacterium]